MQQQTTIEDKCVEPRRAARKTRRISRSEREAARDRANVAATEALFAETEPRDGGGAVPLLPEAQDMLIGNRARLWRTCLERACRRARACTAPFNICIAEPRRPDEHKRGHDAHRRFVRAQAEREAAESASPDRLDADAHALAAGALQLRIAMLRLRTVTPKPASLDSKKAKRR